MLVALYGAYELTRGAADGSWTAAQRHADRIIDFERNLGMFWEWDVQRWAVALPGVPTLLGVMYVVLHVVGTGDGVERYRRAWGLYVIATRTRVPVVAVEVPHPCRSTARCNAVGAVSYTHLTLPTTPYV